MEVRSGPARWHLALTSVGYGDSLHPAAPAIPQAMANRVEYRRGSLTEWYLNGPLGLEQGFTLATPPDGPSTGPLTLTLSLAGNLVDDAGARYPLVVDPSFQQAKLTASAGASGDASARPWPSAAIRWSWGRPATIASKVPPTSSAPSPAPSSRG
ncbi:MAG: hypothetical protein HY713_12045 [candidate division NC10 bacterium]|nr:hypothetical protein [candidate division NC10 bacterium]